ncbi:MAG TPA: hypothetical protein VJ851_02510 [Jatrophihabitans sp.]|nr:hypothetical protein [Jatrophihabitans sp.]
MIAEPWPTHITRHVVRPAGGPVRPDTPWFPAGGDRGVGVAAGYRHEPL